jgi:hypothetical protein
VAQADIKRDKKKRLRYLLLKQQIKAMGKREERMCQAKGTSNTKQTGKNLGHPKNSEFIREASSNCTPSCSEDYFETADRLH